MSRRSSELLDLEETRTNARDARETLGRSRREDPPQPGRPNPDDPDGGDGDQAGQYRTFAQYARDAILVRHSNVASSVERPVFERAERRLQRAVSQVLTSDIPGIVPTQHIAQIMDTIDASRPLVDASTKSALTSGKIAFPQITERPVVGKQAAEKTTAGDGSMTVTMVEKLAATFLSAANFSWQSIQWSNPDALALWFDLAAADYARKTDAEVGAMLAALDSAPTVVASPDLEGWMAAVAEAAYHVYNQTGRYADTIAADPETGYKLLGLVGTSSPVFLATGPANLANGTFPTIGGLRFIISAGLPSATAIVGDFDAVLVAETPGARSSCGQSSRRLAGLRSASSARSLAPSPTQRPSAS